MLVVLVKETRMRIQEGQSGRGGLQSKAVRDSTQQEPFLRYGQGGTRRSSVCLLRKWSRLGSLFVTLYGMRPPSMMDGQGTDSSWFAFSDMVTAMASKGAYYGQVLIARPAKIQFDRPFVRSCACDRVWRPRLAGTGSRIGRLLYGWIGGNM